MSIRTFTSQTAKEAAKHVGKAALEAGKTVAVDAGKKLIDKAMQPKKKVEDIMSKYTANQTKGSAESTCRTAWFCAVAVYPSKDGRPSRH